MTAEFTQFTAVVEMTSMAIVYTFSHGHSVVFSKLCVLSGTWGMFGMTSTGYAIESVVEVHRICSQRPWFLDQ
jgi:hypothetical protein